MNTKKQWFQAFVSLTWYEILLRFIATFIAKTSELLLAAGLVVSSANFLTDGAILGSTTFASIAWAWTQALAIDSSLAISFYYVLQCFKQRDWAKCVLYSVLTLLLALVAGTITNIDIYSHAVHATIGAAMKQIGVDVGLLSTLRAVAVVGFVLMSRLRDVSLKELYRQDGTALPQEQMNDTHQITSANRDASRLTVDEVAVLVNVFSQRGATTIKEVPEELGTQQVVVHEEEKEQSESQDHPHQTLAQPSSRRTKTSKGPAPQPPMLTSDNKTVSDAEITATQMEESQQEKRDGAEHDNNEQVQLMGSSPQYPDEVREQKLPAPTLQSVPVLASNEAQQDELSQEQRLEQAYHELKAGRKKPSGRALAERAHIHRSTCNAWLKAHASKKPLSDRVVPHVDTDYPQES